MTRDHIVLWLLTGILALCVADVALQILVWRLG